MINVPIGMIFKALAATIIIIIAYFDSFSYADTNEPLDHARKDLETAQFDSALRWLDLSERDFDKAVSVTETRFQKALLLTTKELAFTKLLRLWNEGSKLERVSNEDSKMMVEVRRYEDENRKLGKILASYGIRICQKQEPLTLVSKISKFDDAVEDNRKTLRRGEALPKKDREKLEIEEWKLSYAGLLTEIIGPLKEEEDYLIFQGAVHWPVLFLAIGPRLTIALKFFGDLSLTKAAGQCFAAAA
ncbi:MAG: hypothetical protein KDD48_08825, partial [Bdellovibrionales bacterium]|nr:hypothetical protein [Bdellovibrionales bacterium]